MSRFATPKLTVSGRRQTGKTQMLLREAVWDAAMSPKPRKVFYVSENRMVARNNLTRAEGMVRGLKDVKVFRANGAERIEFPSGAQIFFRSINGTCLRVGETVDTLILDCVRNVDEFLAEVGPRLSTDARIYIGVQEAMTA